MRKLITITTLGLLALVLAAPASAFDMDAKTWYGQGLITLPMGDFGDFAGTGFGGAIGMRVPHDAKFTFRGEAGYVMYGGKDLGIYDYSFSMIPIMALAEIQFDPESKVYGLGGAGFAIVRSSWEGTIPAIGLIGAQDIDESESSTELTLSLGGGFHASETVDIEARYNIISDTSYLSIHANFAF